MSAGRSTSAPYGGQGSAPLASGSSSSATEPGILTLTYNDILGAATPSVVGQLMRISTNATCTQALGNNATNEIASLGLATQVVANGAALKVATLGSGEQSFLLNTGLAPAAGNRIYPTVSGNPANGGKMTISVNNVVYAVGMVTDASMYVSGVNNIVRGILVIIDFEAATQIRKAIVTGTTTLSITTINDLSFLKRNGSTIVEAPQQAAIADAAGGVVIDAEARTALNDLLAKLRTMGVIAT